MSSSAFETDIRVADVKVSDVELSIRLKDGRTIAAPLAWYPRLLHATKSQRRTWEIAGGGYGVHWPDVDEDLSVEGLLRGARAPLPQNRPKRAAGTRRQH